MDQDGKQKTETKSPSNPFGQSLGLLGLSAVQQAGQSYTEPKFKTYEVKELMQILLAELEWEFVEVDASSILELREIPDDTD